MSVPIPLPGLFSAEDSRELISAEKYSGNEFVMGPVLFLLFVNNITLQLSRSSVHIFAKDTTKI